MQSLTCETMQLETENMVETPRRGMSAWMEPSIHCTPFR